MKLVYVRAALATALVLAACAPKDETAAPASNDEIVAHFTCGDEAITVTFAGETATLERGGETIALKQVVSGSGAKYEREGDPSTFFWNKGDNGLLSIDGATYPECVKAD